MFYCKNVTKCSLPGDTWDEDVLVAERHAYTWIMNMRCTIEPHFNYLCKVIGKNMPLFLVTDYVFCRKQLLDKEVSRMASPIAFDAMAKIWCNYADARAGFPKLTASLRAYFETW